MKMIYGYARVSTIGQAKEGSSLESQEKTLLENGCEKIFKDAYTGTKSDRPQFTLLLDQLKAGDTLVVTKLDRFARSMIQGSQIVNDLIEKGIKVNILNVGVMDNTPASKLIRNIFFSFAEFERDMIVERTQEGKAIAKQSPNYVDGRPKKYSPNKIQAALELLETKSYNQVSILTGISKSTLIRAKKKADAEKEGK